MSLITRCPKCQSGFEVTADQLRLHDGLVRCGQCSHVFDGFKCLQAELPTLTRKIDQEGISSTQGDLSRSPVAADTTGRQAATPPAFTQASSGAQSGEASRPGSPPATVSNSQASIKPAFPGHDTGRAPGGQPDASATEPSSPTSVSSSASSSTSSSIASSFSSSRSARASEPSLSLDGHEKQQHDEEDSPLVRRISAWTDPPTDRSLYPSVNSSKPGQDKPGSVHSSVREPHVRVRPAVPLRDSREPVLSRLNSAELAADDTTAAESRPLRVMGEARLRGEDPASAGRREPEFLEDDVSSTGATTLWWLVALVLGVLLLGQFALYFRNDLATTMPATRGVLEQICKPLGCEVGYVRHIDRIVIIGSSLQQVESKDGQEGSPYLLKLTLQNRNDYPQPWPSLLLSLSDASGTIISRRVMTPQQYLPVSLENAPFGARQEVALEVPLFTQGLSVSGFELQRFFP